ncbi:MAG: phosphoglycerate kinase [Methanobacteriota archaeon]|nr:MAG: phosphoglycerate kinase [Euryarchaeota archaeon]
MMNSRTEATEDGGVSDDDDGEDSSSESGLEFLTLDDFDVRGRKVVLRADINSPVSEDTLRIEDGSKIASAVPTVRELIDRNACLVVMAHQGRPGDHDFITLNEHADYLTEFLGRRVRYVNDIHGSRALKAIRSLSEGECVLLQNVRNYSSEQLKLSPEEHAQSEMVRKLTPELDLFVNDAFASSHRSHASLVGFTWTLPSAAGRLMEREMKALTELLRDPARPSTFIFGGAKFVDTLPVLKRLVASGSADHIILAGLVGCAFRMVQGDRVGAGTERLASRGVTEEVRKTATELIEAGGSKMKLPIDGAIEENGVRVDLALEDVPEDATILDIGPQTIDEFAKVIASSKTLFLSGPPGVYEVEEFAKGTKELFLAIATSGAFSVIGGGHSSAAVNRLGFKDRFSYVSTGGGAVERMILGKPMPVIEALKMAASRT